MYDHILVPVDGSNHSMNAVQYAIGMVRKMNFASKVTVLHVNPSIRFFDPIGVNIDIDQVLEDEGKRIIEPVVKRLLADGIPCDSISVKGDPAQEICMRAKDGNYDLIIMGSRGLGAFSEVVLGSVSHKVVQHAACPVLIIK